LVDKNIKSISITPENLDKYLGIKKYKFGVAEESYYIGACAGLSYSEVGGDLLLIESALLPGKGEMKITGKLGDVMQESMQAALSVVKSRSAQLKISPEKYKDNDIHLHVPEGAVPKDGPSAGIAIFTSLVSLLTDVPVKNDVAMTGEITLRGKVLPIGGLKEKLLGAARGGIKTVVIPSDNQKDLSEIPDDIKSKLNIIAISKIESLYDIAFAHNPIK
jgi:ATP-dependent Lon protease